MFSFRVVLKDFAGLVAAAHIHVVNKSHCGLSVRICRSHEIATQPVILWIELGGKPKWLPLNSGYHDDGKRVGSIALATA